MPFLLPLPRRSTGAHRRLLALLALRPLRDDPLLYTIGFIQFRLAVPFPLRVSPGQSPVRLGSPTGLTHAGARGVDVHRVRTSLMWQKFLMWRGALLHIGVIVGQEAARYRDIRLPARRRTSIVMGTLLCLSLLFFRYRRMTPETFFGTRVRLLMYLALSPLDVLALWSTNLDCYLERYLITRMSVYPSVELSTKGKQSIWIYRHQGWRSCPARRRWRPRRSVEPRARSPTFRSASLSVAAATQSFAPFE